MRSAPRVLLRLIVGAAAAAAAAPVAVARTALVVDILRGITSRLLVGGRDRRSFA